MTNQNELRRRALAAGAAYTANPSTGEPIYLFDAATLAKFLDLSKPTPPTDAELDLLWQDCFAAFPVHRRFARRLLEKILVE